MDEQMRCGGGYAGGARRARWLRSRGLLLSDCAWLMLDDRWLGQSRPDGDAGDVFGQNAQLPSSRLPCGWLRCCLSLRPR